MNLYFNIDSADRYVSRAVLPAVSRAGGKMKKHISLVMLLALLLGMSAMPLWGQQTGAIKGTVKDQNGKPLDGATVELIDPETGRKYDLKTNAKGEYSSIGIALGTYDVSLLKDGKTLDKVSKVPVIPGEEAKVVNLSAQQSAGMSEEQKKKVEEVQKHNEKVKTLNASLAQAKQLEGAGNYEEAITVLQQATQVDPTQDLVWFSLGDAQRGAKKYPEAIESYQKAIAIKSTVGAYHNNLADAYAKSGQTEKAVQEYTAAAQAEPANAATYYFNEGAVFTNTGKTEEAVVAFDKAIQADPAKAAAYYWKGVNMLAKATTKGDKMVAPDGTAQAFNKYLELEPTGQYADAAKQMLAMIGAPVETTFGKAKTAPPPKKKP
jgi:tetratricopeptide (TPR) repeat protein